MTSIKDLLWLAETGFHWLWQIWMFSSDEVNLAQDGQVDIRFVKATRQLKVDWTKFSLWQVDITFVTAAWQLKIDIGKLTLYNWGIILRLTSGFVNLRVDKSGC